MISSRTERQCQQKHDSFDGHGFASFCMHDIREDHGKRKSDKFSPSTMIDAVKMIERNLQSFVPRSARSLLGALLNHWFARILSELSTDRLLLCSETYGSIGSNSSSATRVPDRPGCGRSS